MPHRLSIAKRVSLKGFGPDWGDECYALMMPATYEDMLDADGLNTKPKAEQVKYQEDFLKKHFVSGKVKTFDSDDVVDMEPDDVMASVTLSDRLFAACIGDDIDPKELEQAAATLAAPASDEKPIETPSSTSSNTSQTSPNES